MGLIGYNGTHAQLCESEKIMDGYRFSFITGVLLIFLGEASIAGLVFCTGMLVESPLMDFVQTWIETLRESTTR